MIVDEAVERLQRGQMLVIALFEQLPEEYVRWKPAPDQWSLLEVMGHLADEEVLDFRARIESTLSDPKRPWPPISPQDWVAEKNYNARDPKAALDLFLAERRKSLEWLRTQRGARWDNAYVHPKAGPLSAKLLLANWQAHDLLHGRQMLRLHHQRLGRAAAPDSLDYAGPW